MSISVCGHFLSGLGGRDHLDPKATKVTKQNVVQDLQHGQAPKWESEGGKAQPFLCLIQVLCKSLLQLTLGIKCIHNSNSNDPMLHIGFMSQTFVYPITATCPYSMHWHLLDNVIMRQRDRHNVRCRRPCVVQTNG